jgi:hypothetical protein
LVAVESDAVFPSVEALLFLVIEGAFECERFDDGFRRKGGKKPLQGVEGTAFEGGAGEGQGGRAGEHSGTEHEVCGCELASPFDGFSPDAGGRCRKHKSGFQSLAGVDSDAEVRETSRLTGLDGIGEGL